MLSGLMLLTPLHDIGKLACAICAMVDVHFLEFCCPLVSFRYQVHRIVNKGLKKLRLKKPQNWINQLGSGSENQNGSAEIKKRQHRKIIFAIIPNLT